MYICDIWIWILASCHLDYVEVYDMKEKRLKGPLGKSAPKPQVMWTQKMLWVHQVLYYLKQLWRI